MTLVLKYGLEETRIIWKCHFLNMDLLNHLGNGLLSGFVYATKGVDRTILGAKLVSDEKRCLTHCLLLQFGLAALSEMSLL